MRKTVSGVLAVAIVFGASAAAVAQQENRQDVQAGFTTKKPRTSTGFTTRIFYRDPADAEAKPRPVRNIVTIFPKGTKFDGGAVPVCEASDAELMSEGREACPGASRIGGGRGTAITGVGMGVDPLRFDLTIFNAPGGIILVASNQETGDTLAVNRGTQKGRTLTTPNPPTPGVPEEFQPALREIEFTTDARSSGGRNLTTTPAQCPRSGRLTTRFVFTYDDGATSSDRATTPCTRTTRRPISRRPRSRGRGIQRRNEQSQDLRQTG